MRNKLRDRRPSITQNVVHTNSNGDEEKYLLTFGFDHEMQVREVFCANRMVGSDMHAILTDVCILISLHLQTGAEPEKLVRSLGENRGEGQGSGPAASIAGSIARAIVLLQNDVNQPAKELT